MDLGDISYGGCNSSLAGISCLSLELPCDLCIVGLMIMFALCFKMGKVHRLGTFLRCRAG